jgi:hypothetical protein
MSETLTFFVKQVWRQKGDALFDRIPFKEANKAQELSQTTRPVLLLETKTGGGCGAVFAVGRVAEHVVIEEAIEYPNGEFFFHVPFVYERLLADKKKGVTREELQELTGLKFAPQTKGGLYAIEENMYEQIVALLEQRGLTTADPSVMAEASLEETEVQKHWVDSVVAKSQVAATVETAEAPQASGADDSVMKALAETLKVLEQRPELRMVIEEGRAAFYPAALLNQAEDLVEVQQVIEAHIKSGRPEVSEEGADVSPRFAKLIGLVLRLVQEGRYQTVQIPTMQKAFYREAKLPHPYLAVELQGKQGHHVLGIDGTLYTTEGKTVQHYLGL